MFCPLPYRDTLIVFRGLLILVVVVVLGVAISERQLNSLTQRQDSVGIFNVNCDYDGVYSIEILGASYTMRSVYVVGEIINTDKVITIITTHHSITIPTYIELDCKKELLSLELGAKLLIDQGVNLKKSLEQSITGLPLQLNVYIRHFR